MKYDYRETIDFLLDWYDLNARILPWRSSPEPYYVWVSEIMLQQTRVEAVKVYFERFIETLPNVEALANVEEDRLLKLWEGLGYYNRARNLFKAARIIMDEHDGIVPNDYNTLLTLPGIGTYTAGAISSIAYGVNRPAVDGNVLRVMKRVAGSFDDITKASVKKELEEDLYEIMPLDRPGDYNQSIMELGATVCIPNGRPLCDKCPLMHMCKAFHNGHEMLIPVKPAKKPRRVEKKTIVLIRKDGKYGIKKRPSKGLLSGMWELPNMNDKLGTLALTEALENMGLGKFTLTPLGEANHIFSHIEWHMVGYLLELDEIITMNMVNEHDDYKVVGEIIKDCVWATKDEIDSLYSLPTAFEKYRNAMID